MARKLSIATSALNRLLNFLDELEAPVVDDPMEQGDTIDAALQMPTPDMPAAPAIGEAVIMDALGLPPR